MKYQYKKIVSKCPLCSNKNNLLLYSINSENATRYLISKKNPKKFIELKKLIESFWKGKECKKILCKNCLLFYTSPFVGGDKKFYSQIYSSSSKYPSNRWDYDRTIDALKSSSWKSKSSSWKSKSSSLLEIGAGTGEFLKKIPKEILPRQNLFSCEISEVGKKELKKKGIKNYENMMNIQKKFETVCIFETIEHLDIIPKLFKKVKEIISKEGHLFISTTTQKTVKFFEQRGSGLDLPPTHITCWNKKSFETLAKKYGFKIIERKLKKLSVFRKNLNFGLGIFETKKLGENSIENKIDKIHSKKLRKFLMFVYLFVGSPYFFLNTFGKKLYSSQWIHLQKEK